MVDVYVACFFRLTMQILFSNISCVRPANERRRYIDWAHTETYPWIIKVHSFIFVVCVVYIVYVVYLCMCNVPKSRRNTVSWVGNEIHGRHIRVTRTGMAIFESFIRQTVTAYLQLFVTLPKSMSLQTVVWNPYNSSLKTSEPCKPIHYHIYWYKTECYNRLQKYASRYLCIISTDISHGLYPIP